MRVVVCVNMAVVVFLPHWFPKPLNDDEDWAAKAIAEDGLGLGDSRCTSLGCRFCLGLAAERRIVVGSMPRSGGHISVDCECIGLPLRSLSLIESARFRRAMIARMAGAVRRKFKVDGSLMDRLEREHRDEHVWEAVGLGGPLEEIGARKAAALLRAECPPEPVVEVWMPARYGRERSNDPTVEDRLLTDIARFNEAIDAATEAVAGSAADHECDLLEWIDHWISMTPDPEAMLAELRRRLREAGAPADTRLITKPYEDSSRKRWRIERLGE